MPKMSSKDESRMRAPGVYERMVGVLKDVVA